MIWLLYFLSLYIMVLGIRIASLWNTKSARWVSGRKNWRQTVDALPEKSGIRIWFHVSSLGEFEQARPVMESLKQIHPNTEIILSFFSPSGYEIRKNYPLAHVLYLPPDLPGQANTWIEKIAPDVAVFVKYDFWPGYLNALITHQIPFLVISAYVRAHAISSWSFTLTRRLLKKANMIFVQDSVSADYLNRNGFPRVQLAGDTRIDRSLSLPNEAAARIPVLLSDLGPFDVVAGSIWPEDEELLFPILEKLNLKAIVAPHDVSEANIKRILHALPFPALRLSTLTVQNEPAQIILVDTIGQLAFLYTLGKIAYVGGGFGKGIHNILEPAAHERPIIFGPKYQKFPEALEMIRIGAVKSISDSRELEAAILHFLGEAGAKAGLAAEAYLQKNKGATQIVTSYLLESIPFTR